MDLDGSDWAALGCARGEVQRESTHAPSSALASQALCASSLDVCDGRSAGLCLDACSGGEWPDQGDFVSLWDSLLAVSSFCHLFIHLVLHE